LWEFIGVHEPTAETVEASATTEEAMMHYSPSQVGEMGPFRREVCRSLAPSFAWIFFSYYFFFFFALHRSLRVRLAPSSHAVRVRAIGQKVKQEEKEAVTTMAAAAATTHLLFDRRWRAGKKGPQKDWIAVAAVTAAAEAERRSLARRVWAFSAFCSYLLSCFDESLLRSFMLALSLELNRLS
jgi:hypothetical protein